MLLHAQGGLLEMICLEAVVCFAFDALEVHLNRLVGVLRMLVAISCLLVEILCVIFTILFCAEHVAEESTFQSDISL